MDETQKATEGLVLKMRKKLSLYDLDRKVRLNAVFFADKTPQKPYICSTMKTVLSRFGNIGVTASNERDPDDKMFSVTADDEEAAKAILDSSPWSIMGFSVHFQEWPESMAIEELPRHQIAFWVQVRGVPPYMFDEENVNEMVENFGTFIRMDDPLECEEGSYSFLRVRILLDARDPLPTGYQLPRDDGTLTWVSFSYEKLSDFCYVCGRLGHAEKPKVPCPFGADPNNPEIEYGPWMRTVAPRKQVVTVQSQDEAGKRRRRRFPGQTIQPLPATTTGQNSQSQGASLSHTSEQSINQSAPQVRHALMSADTYSHIPVVNQLESNHTRNISIGQSNYPMSYPHPLLNHSFTPLSPPGFGSIPNNLSGAFVLDKNQNSSNMSFPWFMPQRNIASNVGHPENLTAAALATLFSSSFSHLAHNNSSPFSSPTSFNIPNPTPQYPIINNQIPFATVNVIHGKRPLQVDVPNVPKPRKIRRFTNRIASGSETSQLNSEEAIDGSSTSKSVEGGGGWPAATRSP